MSDKSGTLDHSDQERGQADKQLITSNEYKEGRSALVIGMGLFGFSVAKRLTELGWFVLAVDGDPERLKEVAKEVSSVRVINAVNLEVIKTLEPSTFDLCISAIGNESAHMIGTTIHNLKVSGAEVVIARSTSKDHNVMFEKLGCDLLVEPEHYFGVEFSELLHHITDYTSFKHLKLQDRYSIDLDDVKRRSAELTKEPNNDSKGDEFKASPSTTLIKGLQILVWILLLEYAYQLSNQLDILILQADDPQATMDRIVGPHQETFFKVTGLLIIIWIILSSYLKSDKPPHD